MVDNLVRNAVHHSPPAAAVRIHAELQDGHALIEVRDRGPGIPEAELDRVFEPFVRVAADGQAARPEGSGLGLWVCHSLIEQHGGTLTVQNLSQDRGVVFTVTLPMIEESVD